MQFTHIFLALAATFSTLALPATTQTTPSILLFPREAGDHWDPKFGTIKAACVRPGAQEHCHKCCALPHSCDKWAKGYDPRRDTPECRGKKYWREHEKENEEGEVDGDDGGDGEKEDEEGCWRDPENGMVYCEDGWEGLEDEERCESDPETGVVVCEGEVEDVRKGKFWDEEVEVEVEDGSEGDLDEDGEGGDNEDEERGLEYLAVR